MRSDTLKPQFVENAPETLEDGIVYISIPFRVAVHKCCCGCGGEVTTRISPTGWEITYDGRDISFSPSIGPTTSACKSHYIVRRGRLKWFPPMTDTEIDRVRARDARLRAGLPEYEPAAPVDDAPAESPKRSGLLESLKRWIFG